MNYEDFNEYDELLTKKSRSKKSRDSKKKTTFKTESEKRVKTRRREKPVNFDSMSYDSDDNNSYEDEGWV